MTVAKVAVTGASAAGTYLSYKGQKAQGKAAKRAGEATSRQYLKRAKQEEEHGAREAIEIRKQGKALRGNAKVAMVASGGSTDDVGAIKLDADLAGVVDYNAMAAIFEAHETAKQSRESARVARAGGQAASAAANRSAEATLLTGASSAFSHYIKPTP